MQKHATHCERDWEGHRLSLGQPAQASLPQQGVTGRAEIKKPQPAHEGAQAQLRPPIARKLCRQPTPPKHGGRGDWATPTAPLARVSSAIAAAAMAARPLAVYRRAGGYKP